MVQTLGKYRSLGTDCSPDSYSKVPGRREAVFTSTLMSYSDRFFYSLTSIALQYHIRDLLLRVIESE